MVSHMQEIRSFFASEQKSYITCNENLFTKYFLVVFALSFIHSFRVENDYLADLTQLVSACSVWACTSYECTWEVWRALKKLELREAPQPCALQISRVHP